MDSRKNKAIPQDTLKALASTAQYISSHSYLIYTHLTALFDLIKYPSVFEIELGDCRNGSEEQEVSETDIAQAERVLNNPAQYSLLSPITTATYHEWLGNVYLEDGSCTLNNEKILKGFEHYNAAIRIHFQTLLDSKEDAHTRKEIGPATLHLKPLAKTAHQLGKIYYLLNYHNWSEPCFALELNIRSAFIYSTKVKDLYLANACLRMGIVYSKSNKHEQALKYFHRAIAASEKHTNSLNWIWGKSSAELGKTYHKLGTMNVELAEKRNSGEEKLIQEDTPNPLEQARDHFESAAVYFTQAIQHYSNSSTVENNKRFCSLNKSLGAIKRLQKIVCDLLNHPTPQLNKCWPITSQSDTRLSTQSFLRGPRTYLSPNGQRVPSLSVNETVTNKTTHRR